MFDRFLKKEEWKQKQVEKQYEIERQEKEGRLADAVQGKFRCWLLENAKEIDGAYCYTYSAQGASLTIKNDGLYFSQLLLYRNRTSATLGGSMQSATVTSLFVTAAATQTVALFIPWDGVKWCSNSPIANYATEYTYNLSNSTQHVLLDNGKQYRVLFFDNTSKERKEWIGFGIVRADDKDVQDLFLDHLAKHGVDVKPPSEVICPKCEGIALSTDKFCQKCGVSLESE